LIADVLNIGENQNDKISIIKPFNKGIIRYPRGASLVVEGLVKK